MIGLAEPGEGFVVDGLEPGPDLHVVIFGDYREARCRDVGQRGPKSSLAVGRERLGPIFIGDRIEQRVDVSLLGGEPFAQASALAPFAEGIRAAGRTVMIFSGYTLVELRSRGAEEPAVARLLAATDLLVDGRFEADQRSSRRRFIGSENQGLHFLSDRYGADDPRLHGPQSLEIRLRGGELTVNGWPLLGARTRIGRG